MQITKNNDKNMALKIELWVNNSILRAQSEELKQHEFKQYEKFAKEMLKYVKNPKNGWVGLAAPQVGLNKRIIVCGLPQDWDDEDFRVLIMINPEILEHSEEQIVWKEWCLSLPKSPRGNVKRYRTIKFRFLDFKWKQHTLVVSELAAVVVQHEIDHLNWILYIDKLEKTWTLQES